MRTLVVFYSRTGNTRQVGCQLAEQLEAQYEEICDQCPRDGIGGYLKAGKDALLKRNTDIRALQCDVEDYDIVIVGGPVWGFTVAPAVRVFLEQSAEKLPEVAFFCTMGGSGAKRTFQGMETACGRKPKACLAIKEPQLKKQGVEDKIREFAKAVLT